MTKSLVVLLRTTADRVVGWSYKGDADPDPRVLLRQAADEIESLKRELERQQALWTTQSKIIRALADEVPDDVRVRVLAPLSEESRVG